FLEEHPEMRAEIEDKLLSKYGMSRSGKTPAAEQAAAAAANAAGDEAEAKANGKRRARPNCRAGSGDARPSGAVEPGVAGGPGGRRLGRLSARRGAYWLHHGRVTPAGASAHHAHAPGVHLGAGAVPAPAPHPARLGRDHGR